MVLDSLIIKDGTVQKISGSTEKKIAAVGLTKLLCETDELTAGHYADRFPSLLVALIGLFELPEDESIPDDEHFIEIEDTPGYQTAYSQLIFAGKPAYDPVAGVSNINNLKYNSTGTGNSSVVDPDSSGSKLLCRIRIHILDPESFVNA